MTESPKTTLLCSQCGKPAVFILGDHPICIDCNYKLKQSQWMVFAQAATMMNIADNDLSAMFGSMHMPNQVKIPPAPIPPIHYNNQTVNVTGGTVGAINFGNVNEIQVSLQALTQNGETGVADAMASLTNAILQSDEIAEDQKNELLEKVAFLSSQATATPAERKPGMIKSMVSAVKEGAGAVASVAGAWAAVEPLLAGHFGI